MGRTRQKQRQTDGPTPCSSSSEVIPRDLVGCQKTKKRQPLRYPSITPALAQLGGLGSDSKAMKPSRERICQETRKPDRTPGEKAKQNHHPQHNPPEHSQSRSGSRLPLLSERPSHVLLPSLSVDKTTSQGWSGPLYEAPLAAHEAGPPKPQQNVSDPTWLHHAIQAEDRQDTTTQELRKF